MPYPYRHALATDRHYSEVVEYEINDLGSSFRYTTSGKLYNMAGKKNAAAVP